MTEYNYQCLKNEGHGHLSPRPMTKCDVFSRGVPCNGKLKRVGAGSRKDT